MELLKDNSAERGGRSRQNTMKNCNGILHTGESWSIDHSQNVLDIQLQQTLNNGRKTVSELVRLFQTMFLCFYCFCSI